MTSGGEPLRTRDGVPVRAYFVMLFALCIGAALIGGIVVNRQVKEDARRSAASAAQVASARASRALSDYVSVLRATVTGVAATPTIAKALLPANGCSLAFTGPGDDDRGHLDVIAADGTVTCSSAPGSASKRHEVYAGAPWLGSTLARPQFVAPVRDAATGREALLTSTPIPGGKGTIAAFTDLNALGPYLSATYGLAEPTEFLVTSGRGIVLARSIHSQTSIGASLANTWFARHRGSVERRDMNGVPRLYGSSAIAGTDWTSHAGVDRGAALASVSGVQRRQVETILGSLLVFLLAGWLVYRRVVSPLRRLSGEVASRSGAPDGLAEDIPAAGPAEVRRLAQAVNGLIASAKHQLDARERAEAAAQLSERHYRLLFEGSPHPRWVCDAETSRFLVLNDAVVQVYGYSRDELLTMTVDELLAEGDADSPTFESGGGLTRHRAKDGTLLDILLASREFEFEGRAAWLVLAQDVTEQMKLEEQLRHAQKLEAIGHLAGGMAHDFNNLLVAVRGYAELLERHPDDARAPDWVREVIKASDHATGLTKQLLAFSRKQILQPRVVDLNDLVSETREMLSRLLGETIEIGLLLDPDLGSVRVDPGHAAQVLVNLAVNARDAMPGGGRLTIETTNAVLDERFAWSHLGAEPGEYIVLAVSDTGTGMDKETSDRIFEPFYTTKDVGKGTGLGLSTVYGIVKQNGGDIGVYSELGTGTVFRLYFPRVRDGVDVDAPAQESPAPLRSSGGRILVVDDNEAVRSVVAAMLEEHNFIADVVSNGEEALARSDEQSYDLLVTDLVMPGLDGRSLAKLIGEKQPGIAILYTSGYTSQTVEIDGMDPHAVFLPKPFTINELVTALDSLLGEGPVRDTARV
jgi:two-component system cell cycle sensor histidine kinase/response regulator CckA